MNAPIQACLEEALANELAAINLRERGDLHGAHALKQLAEACLEEAIELEAKA